MVSILINTQDQALLTMIVDESQKVTSDGKKGYLGRTALQKILYFLKVLGVPMSYRFEMHHHGPFCVDILNDADILRMMNIIEDRSEPKKKYSDYHIGSGALELLNEHEEFLDHHRHKASRVIRAMLPLKPDNLELLATLDYAYRWVKATGVTSTDLKKKTINRFFEIKKNKKGKFPEEEVEKAYDSLVKAGILE